MVAYWVFFCNCLLALLLFPILSWAQEERVPATPHQQHCMRVGFGAAFRIQGNPGIVKWFTPGLFPHDEENFSPEQRELSHTAIYIQDDGETAEEKRNWEEPLLLGWQIENEYIAQNGQPVSPGAIFKACLAQKDAKVKSGFIKVASSEDLRKSVCVNKGLAADQLYKDMKVHGMSKEEIVAQLHDPEMAPGQMHEVAVWMYRIEHWQGTWSQWVNTIYKECLNGQ